MSEKSPLAQQQSVDLTNCDQEPIHIPGSIQPHGAMLVCDRDFTIQFASANAQDFLGLARAPARGDMLGDLVGQHLAHAIRNAATKASGPNSPGFAFGVEALAGGKSIDIAAHVYQERTFIEFEQASNDIDSVTALELTRALVRRLAEETSLERLSASAARMVASMLGYDRVMVYKLLHNGAGRVIAERKRTDLNSFLGLHFPASDIPAQARELYRRNWIRMISDVAYAPVPLQPLLAANEAPVDMSYAQLRSVSPIHCEYLQNMGVHASLSISVIVDGELWGLIACHHYSPHAPALSLRIGGELFAQYFSMQVEAIERRARFAAAEAARQRLDRIVFELAPEKDLAASLSPRLNDLSLLLPCDGVGLWIEGQWSALGVTPDEAQMVALKAHLDAVCDGSLCAENMLGEVLPAFAGSSIAGVLAIPVSRKPRDYLLFFRREESSAVNWAGDPEKSVGPLGDRLTPRKSFDLWRQDVKGQSTPWTEADRIIAETIHSYLRDVVLLHTEAATEERKRADIRRRLVNEELNHRVKNVLALTKAIVQQSRRRAESVDAFAESIHGRLRALALAHDQITKEAGGGELRRLLEAEFAAYGGQGGGKARLDGPALRLAGRAYSSFAMVAHELTTNAAKYGGLSREGGRIDVTWQLDEAGDCHVEWRESGGPAVTVPQRSGFGSTLIGQVVPFDLDGDAHIEFPPEGVVARFRIPAQHLLPPDNSAVEAGGEQAPGVIDLSGRRILLLEDQVLIALDAEHCLRQLGADQIQIAPTVEHALDYLKAAPPDVAVLDVNLGDATSVRFAEMLRERGVPFVFATGYGDTIMIPETLKSAPIARKPYGEATLGRAIAAALAKVSDGDDS